VTPSAEISDLVEFMEAQAFADLLAAAPREWGAWSERRAGGWILQAPAIDILLFNRVIGVGLPAVSREELDEVIAPFRSTRLQGWGVQVSPAAEPEDLTDWLGDHGLIRRDNWSKVYRPAGDVPKVETDLRIEPAGARDAAVLGRITRTAFDIPEAREPWLASIVGRPNWHHYLAWAGDEPVAAAALYVVGSVGWLGVAGTLPGARRRGAQSALMARRLADGARLGCQWFVTETGEDLPERPNPSYHNMMRMGFQLAYQRPNYLPA
jgi:hypothetical protein